MKKEIILVVMALLIMPTVFAYTPIPGSPLANKEHPRLHLTKNNILEIKNFISQNYRSEYQAYVDYAWQTNDLTAKANSISESGHDVVKPLMLSQALVGVLGVVDGINYPALPSAFSRRAIERMKTSLYPEGDSLSITAGIVYDWTYQDMTEQERVDIARAMMERAIVHNSGSDTLLNPRTTPFGALMSSDYMESAYAWYIALALFGETNDANFEIGLSKSLDSFYTMALNYGYFDAQNFIAGDDGGWAEWIGYSSWHPKNHMLFVDGWSTATGENYVAGNASVKGKVSGNALKYFPQFSYYAIDPHYYITQNENQYTFIMMGGAQTTDTILSHQEMREHLLFLPGTLKRAGLSQEAGLVSYFIEKYSVPWANYHSQELMPFLGAARGIQKVTPESLNLPESLWSKNLGLFIAKTGFEKESEGAFFVSDSHYRFVLAGANGLGGRGVQGFPGFGLTKFGPLVSTRNVAHRGYGNLDDYDGAHQMNTVYFHEGANNEAYGITAGRVQIDESPADLKGAVEGQEKYEWGGIEQVTKKDGEFYFVRVNRSRSFISGVSHTREYVWVPGTNTDKDSDFLIVYDRTKAPSTASAHWVYHVPWEPDVTGYNTKQDISTGSGLADRKGNAYTGGNIIIKELNSKGDEGDYMECSSCPVQNYVGGANSSGVMFSKTLLPINSKVEVTRVAALDSDVLNRQGALAIKAHRWQVDVAPLSTNGDERFLNVFQAAFNTTPATASSLIETPEMQGVFIERENTGRPNYVVLFTRGAGINDKAISYTINGNGEIRHVITGLKPRIMYQIRDNGVLIESKLTEGDVELWDYKGVAQNIETGVLYFATNLGSEHTITISEGELPSCSSVGVPCNLGEECMNGDVKLGFTATSDSVRCCTLPGVCTIPPKPNCAEGAVTQSCLCGGVEVSSGYCCSGVPSLDQCPTCVPSTEICDGRDNDCDSQIDEGLNCGNIPIAPSNLIATLIGSFVNLFWNVNSDNEDSFIVQRSADGVTWDNIATLPAGSNSYEDSGLLLSPIEGVRDIFNNLFKKIQRIL